MHRHRAPRPRPLPALLLLLILPLIAACGTAPAPPPPAPPGTAPPAAATPLPAAAGPAATPLPAATGTPAPPLPGAPGTQIGALPPPQGTAPLPPPPSPTDTGCPSGAPTAPAPFGAPLFYAQLTFAPPLPAADFARLVCGAGLAVDQVSVQAAPGDWQGEAGANDTAHVLHLLTAVPGPDPRVSLAVIRTDAEQYRRILADPRVHGDTGVDGVPTGSAAAVVNRWFVASDDHAHAARAPDPAAALRRRHTARRPAGPALAVPDGRGV